MVIPLGNSGLKCDVHKCVIGTGFVRLRTVIRASTVSARQDTTLRKLKMLLKVMLKYDAL